MPLQMYWPSTGSSFYHEEIVAIPTVYVRTASLPLAPDPTKMVSSLSHDTAPCAPAVCGRRHVITGAPVEVVHRPVIVRPFSAQIEASFPSRASVDVVRSAT